MSNFSPLRRYGSASPCRTLALSARRHSARFSCISRTASARRSMNTHSAAPRLRASMPSCPVPANRSSTRYMEVWNNVFSQFDNDGHGNYSELKQKNIDTGMGLERLAVVVQDVDSIFDVDTIRALRDRVCELSGKEYHKEHAWDVSIRIITDHIRSATFMISDGILPSNEGRGYVLRRIIRRAARHGRRQETCGSDIAYLCFFP